MNNIVKSTICILLPLVLCGCGLILLGGALTVAAVTGTGYVVYKTGEQAVVTTGKVVGRTAEGVKSAASAVGRGAQDASRGVQEVIFFNNELRSTYPADVRRTHTVAEETLRELGFTGVRGDADASGGKVEALTTARERIVITLKSAELTQTAVTIRIGTRGDMRTSQLIHEHILQGL